MASVTSAGSSWITMWPAAGRWISRAPAMPAAISLPCTAGVSASAPPVMIVVRAVMVGSVA
nr:MULTISPECIES: hypothetical protein [Mycobacterium]